MSKLYIHLGVLALLLLHIISSCVLSGIELGLKHMEDKTAFKDLEGAWQSPVMQQPIREEKKQSKNNILSFSFYRRL